MNYNHNSRLAENTAGLSQPPSYSQSYLPYTSPPPPSYPSSSLAYPIPKYTTSSNYITSQNYTSSPNYTTSPNYITSQNYTTSPNYTTTPNYTTSPPTSSYPNAPPSYQTYQEKSLLPSQNREVLQRGVRASYPEAQPRYFDPASAPSYGTPVGRNFSPDSRDDSPATREPSNQGYQPTSTSSPRLRYRTVEDYHCDYRGGFRPILDSESRDGYTTDGSGSAYRDGSVRGFENFRYPPERESLLSGESTNPLFAAQSNGTSYAKGEGEKQPFLGGVEPVRLTPSWEQRDVSKEELNFKNVQTFETFEVDAEPPGDKYALVFLTLVLHGIGTLMPWNMFITAKKYFVNYKLGTAIIDTKEYTTNFLPYLGYASQVPNVLFNWINIFVQMGGNMTTRIIWSILVEVIIFIMTVVLAMVDSSTWPGIFFWTTMVSVIILNIANGIYQNTIYGLAARLPFKYTGAVVLGSNISGTFTAIINIIAIAMAPNQRTSAIYYFITALFVLLACFDTYFALPLNRFFRYHEALHERAQRLAKRTPGKMRTPYWHIFKCAFPQLFNVFMVFFVTLAVFPAVLADTCRTEENFFISSRYYQAVTCFLTFNLFAMIGNMLPALFIWPGPKFLCIPVLLRLFFIPAFILCHYYPYDVTRIMPVLIDSDWAYWVLAIFLGITSGYYSSLAMMFCPRTVEPEHAPVAGMMGAASLITGIFAGINFQVVCSYAVTNISFSIPGFEDTFRNCTDRHFPS